MWRFRNFFKVVFIAFLFISNSVKGQIQFQDGTWIQICAEARAAGKPIFVEATTAWCGVCRLMENNVFSDPAVANYYNMNFICWKADMGKAENADFGEVNAIHAYPTLLFFETKGTPIFSEIGYKEKDKILAIGQKALEDRAFSFATASLRTAFEEHTKDKNVLFKYYSLLIENGRNADSVGIAALRLMEPEDLKNDTAFKIWFELDQRMESPLLDYFLANKEYFEVTNPKMTYQKPHYILSFNIEMARLAQDEKLLEQTFVFIRKVYSGEEQTSMLKAAEMKYTKC